MKKPVFVLILLFMIGIVFQGCGTQNEIAGSSLPSSVSDSSTPQSGISEKMAYDGVYQYCRSAYDWSVAEENPDMMYLTMGEATESEYQVIFRSYTGSFVYFYVDKSTGATRLIESVPALGIEEEAGTIDLYDYLESDEK